MYWIQRLEHGPKRVNHAAVAVGNAIYSFGGYCSACPLSYPVIDVYIFNTVSLQWHQINLSDMDNGDCPTGLYGHSVVVYKNKVYLWGGINSFNMSTNTLFCLDLTTFIWCTVDTTGSVPKSTDGHSACVIENFMYIFGGYEADSNVLVNMLYKLDLETFKWERVWTKGTPPDARDFHTASVIGKKMYIFGGRSFVQDESDEMYFNQLIYFDTSNNTWVRPVTYGEEPHGRRSHSAAVYNEEIYIVGGCSPGITLELVHLNDVHKFNPELNVWTPLTTLGKKPSPRRRHCTVVVGDKLYLFGGSSPIRQEPVRDYMMHTEFSTRLKEESDLFIMDFSKTLKRRAQLKVIECGFKFDCLPLHLQKEMESLMKKESMVISKSISEILALRRAA